jgi:hypothetical protein
MILATVKRFVMVILLGNEELCFATVEARVK